MSVATHSGAAECAAPLIDDALGEGPKRSRWWIEVLVVVWLCWVYDAINNLAPVRQIQAVAHAHGLYHLEQVLHLDPERPMDHWLAGHHTLALWVSDYYDNAHFVVTFAVVAWLWWHRQDLYRPLRNSLILVNIIGFVVFWLYPLAPPRLLPGAGFVDVVSVSDAFGAGSSLASSANELAAMPSLHMAWAAWSGLAMWRLWRGHRWAWLVWAYPLATGVAVLSTGNHFVADVIAGLLTTAMATLAAERLVPRARRWWRANQVGSPASSR